jgi:FKBP-type peptidyl-prolyl cis-trans isomerase FkpA
VKRLIACVAVALFAVACSDDGGGTPTDPSQVNVEFSFAELTVGTGANVVGPGSQVVMLYELWLYDPAGTASKGVRKGGSSDAGAGPYPFTVGAGQVIPGVDQGVRGMRQGGKRRIYMPPSMAYGNTGQGSIPPNASLVFEIEMSTVQ